MEKCNHIRGLADGKLVCGSDWIKIKNGYDRTFRFYLDNLDSAVLYGIDMPIEPTEFKYCPLCGMVLC